MFALVLSEANFSLRGCGETPLRKLEVARHMIYETLREKFATENIIIYSMLEMS